MRELFRNEGEYAVIAGEIASFPPSTTAHGILKEYSYPLYPLLAKGLSLLGFTMEFSLRFLSVFSLAVLTLVVGIACYSMLGIQAAAAGAAAMLATLLAGEKAIEGYPHMLTVLLCFSGWLLWFYWGQVRGSWNKAWLAAGIFAGFAFYNSGGSALLYFFVPMAFLRRPLTIWNKLNKPGFYAGCAIISVFFLLWLVPRWGNLSVMPFANGSMLKASGHVFLTPFDAALRFLPWTFFLYAPFCTALMTIDRNPLFSKFLRILFYVTLIMLCLDPSSKGRDILFLAPISATLIGLNYWIVVRRHGENICKVTAFCALLLFVAGAGALFYVIASPELIGSITGHSGTFSWKTSGIRLNAPFLEACGCLILAVCTYFLSIWRKQVWLILLTFFCGMMLFFWSVIHPYRAAEQIRTEFGTALRSAIGASYSPQMTVYKDAAIEGLYAECHYLGAKIKSLGLNETGTIAAPELFIISTSSVQPADTSRTWTRVMDRIYKKQNIYLWKGKLNDRQDEPEKDDFRDIRF